MSGAMSSVSETGSELGPRWRIVARRLIVVGVIVAQSAFVVRAYRSDHDEFGFQMFPESSQWQAEVVRITADGERISIDEPWPGGYRWRELVATRGLYSPATKRDADTRALEATVTYWDNTDGPHVTVYRTDEREAAP